MRGYRPYPVWPLLALLLLSAPVARAADEPVTLDPETLAGLGVRCIGPAVTSGRIAAIDGLAGDRLTLWVGSAGGGVWKSKDGGTTFQSVFDHDTQSIGAVAIDPTHPDIVWVGTGESWTRNSVGVGDGIYRTEDGGQSWKKMGLEKTEHIAKIAIDPQHPDTVYVAVPGHVWNSNPERGIYRTRDAGKSWERVLFVSPEAGGADVVIDPKDPNVVYASTWEFRRKPWSFSSGGPGSALYKSEDGGTKWKKLTQGLPAGPYGRIAIAVSASNPRIVYATIEATEGGLFKSEDRGETWKRMNDGANMTVRPFYFSVLAVDPTNPDRVYKPGLVLASSDDGGKTFSQMATSTHSDEHAIWIDPKRPDVLFLGTDGGIYTSEDRGIHWRFLANLPVAQFYHVSYDMEVPYNVYGGLQDNGSWMAPSRFPGGIENRHWRVLGGGDGFWAFVDPKDSDVTYVEYQGGNLLRVRKSTGETKKIMPNRRPDEAEYRFNWNTPIHVSPTQAGTLYMGAQYLFRSRDQGESWERISPDLTTNDPKKLQQEASGGISIDNSSAENHCTIYTISESPKNAQVIWVGTDDGNLQITRDGGKSWENVVRHVPKLPPATWVSCVRASSSAEGTAYATFDGHAMGDMATYVYVTEDFGRTWRPLATSDIEGYAHVILDDPVQPRILYLGTEFGLFISLDAGARWTRLSSDMPRVAVMDLAVQPRENDLLIATHGRGIYILDDLAPLRALTPQVLSTDASFLPSRPSILTIPMSEQRFDGDAEFDGQSANEGATIAYYLKKRHLYGDLRVEVYDGSGQLLTSVPGSKRRGVNRVIWGMRSKAPKIPPATNLVPENFLFVGPRVLPGTYTVKLVRGDQTLSSTVDIQPDPRSGYSADDRATQNRIVMRLYGMLESMTWLSDEMIAGRDQARALAKDAPKTDPLAKRATAFADSLESIRKIMVATREGGRFTGEVQLRERMGTLYGAVNGFDGRPTQSQIDFTDVLESQYKDVRGRFDRVTGSDLTALNTQIQSGGKTPIALLSFDDWKAKQKEK
jgi:photosystem II stability/assembly factor-like uncharacterized protein